MKQTRYKNLERQVNNLIPLVELYLPLIEKLHHTQNELNSLPEQLDSLKQQAQLLKTESLLATSLNSKLEIDETEFKIDSLVDDLDQILACLDVLDLDLKNVLALKEKVEAIQEERIDGITPERIYKLLEKQQQLSQSSKDLNSIEKHNTSLNKRDWRQKISNYTKDLGNKTMAASLIVISLSCGWIAGSYSSSNIQSTENQVVDRYTE